MNTPFAASEKVFSVTEITNIIKDLLENSIPQIVVEGEISNCKRNPSGHIYLTLKDNASQLSAVIFRSAAYYLKFDPKDGQKVQCTGKLSVYGPQGKYQFVITKMEVAGEGAILKMLDERKRRLYAEGLFDESRKKTLPSFPQTIGVVTSPTGAALRDILQITKRRNPCVSVVVLPAIVQGTEAAPSIVRQIRCANEYNLCDVLIVGRGGGSIEDLLPFSEEEVVRAVADSKIPVISAVGHEIDFAISDFAADRRAPTPSAAAELAVPQLCDIKNKLNQHEKDFFVSANNITQKYRLMIQSFKPENLESQFRRIIEPINFKLDNAITSLFDSINQKIKDTKQKITTAVSTLENCSPDTILKRGYAMVRIKENGEIVTKADKGLVGQQIEIIPASGKITATVDNIE